MSARNILMAAAGSADDKLYVDDVFSAYTYTGNGSTQTINNGIDLAGKGGLVWIKNRNSTGDHTLFNTVMGVGNWLTTNNTVAQYSSTSTTAFNSNGFSLANGTYVGEVNQSTRTYVSWTFRKAPKFFDVVTWSGNGESNRAITHGLGTAPGLVIVKNVGTIGGNYDEWNVWHRATGQNKLLTLNSANNSQDDYSNYFWGANAPTASNFYLGSTFTNLGSPSQYYVAYLFAHDPSADGIIQCGSFTADGITNATVNHGWAKGVQFVLLKASSTTGHWEMFDTARTSGWSGNDARLFANANGAEGSVARLSASGANVSFTGLAAGATYIYMFIANP